MPHARREKRAGDETMRNNVGQARASRPLAVFALQRQQPGAPTLGSHPRPLRGDDLRRRMDEIAQHLPADGGIRIKEPVQDVHAGEPSMRRVAPGAGRWDWFRVRAYAYAAARRWMSERS